MATILPAPLPALVPPVKMPRLTPLLLTAVTTAVLATPALAQRPETRDRTKIPAEYRWDFSPIYKSWDAWEAGLKDMEAKMDAFAARKGTLASGPQAVLAAVIYVPLLLTKPGRVGADTKTYLYLDPGRLLSRASSMWDPNIGMGTVTHQNIGYLFPMGPFYLVADLIGLPDWVAQRLWLGTVIFLAGLGVRYLLRTLHLGGKPLAHEAILVASLAYMFSPYLLAYAARISVILLPWTALPWLIGLTIQAVRRGGWWYPSAFALVVLAVGGINATALIMIGVGPLVWLVYAVAVERTATWRQASFRARLRNAAIWA